MFGVCQNRSISELQRNLGAEEVNTNGLTFIPSCNIKPLSTLPAYFNGILHVTSWSLGDNGFMNISDLETNNMGYIRCVVPVEGIFCSQFSNKQPVYVKSSESFLLFLSGIVNSQGEVAIVLTKPYSIFSFFTDKGSPVTMTIDQCNTWLSDDYMQYINFQTQPLHYFCVSKIVYKDEYTGRLCIQEHYKYLPNYEMNPKRSAKSLKKSHLKLDEYIM